MTREESLEVEGTVVEALPNGHRISAHLSGKLRIHFIKIVPGDTVTVELSPNDLTRGRITFRLK